MSADAVGIAALLSAIVGALGWGIGQRRTQAKLSRKRRIEDTDSWDRLTIRMEERLTHMQSEIDKCNSERATLQLQVAELVGKIAVVEANFGGSASTFMKALGIELKEQIKDA